jgi:hypothetical protein
MLLLALVARRALPGLRIGRAWRAAAVAALASAAAAGARLPAAAPLPLFAGAALAVPALYALVAALAGAIHRGDLELLRGVASGRSA